MATKTQVRSGISSALSIVITKAKVLLGFDELVNEVFSAKVPDSQGAETYTTKVSASIAYEISIKKIGTYIRVNGSVSNYTGATLPNGAKIFDFKDNQYRGDTSFYTGVGVYYEPYCLRLLNPLLNGGTTTFVIEFNPNTI